MAEPWKCPECGAGDPKPDSEIEHRPDCKQRLKPHDQPQTKEEALYMAQKWGNEWSHWNQVAEALGSPDAPGGHYAPVICAQWDAAEVQRLSALFPMLPDVHPEAPF